MRFLLFAIFCGALAAQDVSGRWTGAADTTDEGGTKRMEQQSFEIKVVDGKLTAVSIGRKLQPFVICAFRA